MFMGLDTRSRRPEKLTARIDCTKILALPVHTSKISILIFLVIEGKSWQHISQETRIPVGTLHAKFRQGHHV